MQPETNPFDFGQKAAFDTQTLFNRQLATYRKVVDANLMFHREVYHRLGNVLDRDMPGRFSFLDIACGDASASAAMLRGRNIGHYFGIDLSEPSLALAREILSVLSCPVDLQCRDFTEAMADWETPVDIAWIGMSLHHLQADGKLALMRDIHAAMGRHGRFLIWEPTLLDGESRTDWLDRFASQRSVWAALTDDEFADMEGHMRLADFPESAETWTGMGLEAGFVHGEQIFMMPNRFGRVFKYWN